MNQKQRQDWTKTRQRGIWRYVLLPSLGVAVGFLLFDALLGSGYTLLLKQGNWKLYIEQLNWKKLVWQGFFVGAAIYYFSWHRNERLYKSDSAN